MDIIERFTWLFVGAVSVGLCYMAYRIIQDIKNPMDYDEYEEQYKNIDGTGL